MILLILLLSLTGAMAQDTYDFWPDPDLPPPSDIVVFLPLPTNNTGGDEHYHPGDAPALERDGLPYKAIQRFHDASFDVTIPAGKYVLGWLGNFWPESVDGIALLRAQSLTAEINDDVFPLSAEDIASVTDFPFVGLDLAAFDFYPRFLQPGSYVLRYRWRQLEPFFFVWPFGSPTHGPAADPLTGFDGRRVFVSEQEGDPLDGEMVTTYHLTVTAQQTAVTGQSWAQVKACAHMDSP